MLQLIGNVVGLFVEYKRNKAVARMSSLATAFVYEYAQFTCDDFPSIIKEPGDSPGSLVEAIASEFFISYSRLAR